jgi:hypothetical protein
MINNPKCFVCHEACLGLKGQDVICDTFYTLSGVEDKQMLEAQAFGEFHLKCLMSSQWGNYWSKRILNNLVLVRHYPIIGEINGVTVLRNERIRTTFLLGNNGWRTEVYDKDMKERIPASGEFHLPVKHDFNVNLLDYPTVASEIQNASSKNEDFPLVALVDRLGAHAEYNEFLPDHLAQFILTDIDIERPSRLPDESML